MSMQERMAMHVVTVSREYGSGGGEIARHLAARLGWQLLDHQIVERVAQKLGISESEAEVYDEHTEGFAERLLESMDSLSPPMGVAFVPESVREIRYQEALRQLLLNAASLGRVVIVGRAAVGLLAVRLDALRVRLVAQGGASCDPPT